MMIWPSTNFLIFEWARSRLAPRPTLEPPAAQSPVAAFACAMVLMGACIGATSSWFQAGLTWLRAGIISFDPKAFIPYATALIEGHGLLVACMLAMVFVVPVAVYLAIGKD